MIKVLVAAAVGSLSGGALAQGSTTGTVKPFASVPFAPDPEVATAQEQLIVVAGAVMAGLRHQMGKGRQVSDSADEAIE